MINCDGEKGYRFLPLKFHIRNNPDADHFDKVFGKTKRPYLFEQSPEESVSKMVDEQQQPEEPAIVKSDSDKAAAETERELIKKDSGQA